MITAHPNGRVFWAGLLLILAAFTATAQEFRGSLAGKIIDPNGAVVPGSKVEIKNVETGIVSNTTTGEDGTYSFALLPPGKYQLTVTKENFNTAVRDGIQVRVADRLTLDVQLEIGVTAMVTTVASGLTLDTGTVNTGTVVTGKQISELPLTEGIGISTRDTRSRHRLHRQPALHWTNVERQPRRLPFQRRHRREPDHA